MREPNQHLAQSRQRKAVLLPRAAARALGTPRMTARLAARYESMYHRAVREFNRSRTDRHTESGVTITPAGGSPTSKTTVRTEPRIGSAACPGKALAATQALEGLHRRERARQERLASDATGGLASDAAGKEDGLARTVKSTMTPSGRKVRTVVTTRSDDGGLAALRDAQKALDGDADNGSARSVNVGAAGMPGDRCKSFTANDLRVAGCDFAAVRRSAYVKLRIM